MKKIIITSYILLIGLNGFGQENATQFADKMPLFNGATEENNRDKIKAHFDGCGLKVIEDGKTPYIGVTFLIDSVGIPTSHNLLLGNDSIMLNKIIKCMENTPKWIPATKGRIDVSCWFNIAFEK